MLLFSLLRNYDLEEQGCTEQKVGTGRTPMTSLCSAPCMEIKDPAQTKRIHSRFLKRQECNHTCKRYCTSLRLNTLFAVHCSSKTNKQRCTLVNTAVSYSRSSLSNLFPQETQIWFLTTFSVGSQRQLAPKENCYSQDPMNEFIRGCRDRGHVGRRGWNKNAQEKGATGTSTCTSKEDMILFKKSDGFITSKLKQSFVF